jgi:hypothetical protein
MFNAYLNCTLTSVAVLSRHVLTLPFLVGRNGVSPFPYPIFGDGYVGAISISLENPAEKRTKQPVYEIPIVGKNCLRSCALDTRSSQQTRRAPFLTPG